MTQRIADVFARQHERGKKVLIAYLCVGDPSEDESLELALAAAEAGADILELGCPFSDPSADGPAIARASERSLSRGGGLDATLRVAEGIRKRSSVPMVLFGYYNPLFVRGDERAANMCHAAGIDSLLVVDLPVDASATLRAALTPLGLGLVPLVTPTTSDARIRALYTISEQHPIPFVYYVSMTGVTGGAGPADVLALASKGARHVRESTGVPTVVGFGIDSAERAQQAAKDADGIVVGSELVRRIEQGATRADRVKAVQNFLRELRAAV